MNFGRKDYNDRIIDKEDIIPNDEPVFLLRSSDKLSPRLLLTWALEARLAGADPVMITSVEKHAQLMIEWQKTHTAKVSDMNSNSERKDYIKTIIKNLLESDHLNISTLIDWISKYTGGNGYDDVIILLPTDLKSNPKSILANNLTLDDFEISDEQKLEMMSKDLIIYYNCSKDFKVFKNNL